MPPRKVQQRYFVALQDVDLGNGNIRLTLLEESTDANGCMNLMRSKAFVDKYLGLGKPVRICIVRDEPAMRLRRGLTPLGEAIRDSAKDAAPALLEDLAKKGIEVYVGGELTADPSTGLPPQPKESETPAQKAQEQAQPTRSAQEEGHEVIQAEDEEEPPWEDPKGLLSEPVSQPPPPPTPPPPPAPPAPPEALPTGNNVPKPGFTAESVCRTCGVVVFVGPDGVFKEMDGKAHDCSVPTLTPPMDGSLNRTSKLMAEQVDLSAFSSGLGVPVLPPLPPKPPEK